MSTRLRSWLTIVAAVVIAAVCVAFAVTRAASSSSGPGAADTPLPTSPAAIAAFRRGANAVNDAPP